MAGYGGIWRDMAGYGGIRSDMEIHQDTAKKSARLGGLSILDVRLCEPDDTPHPRRRGGGRAPAAAPVWSFESSGLFTSAPQKWRPQIWPYDATKAQALAQLALARAGHRRYRSTGSNRNSEPENDKYQVTGHRVSRDIQKDFWSPLGSPRHCRQGQQGLRLAEPAPVRAKFGRCTEQKCQARDHSAPSPGVASSASGGSKTRSTLPRFFSTAHLRRVCRLRVANRQGYPPAGYVVAHTFSQYCLSCPRRRHLRPHRGGSALSQLGLRMTRE